MNKKYKGIIFVVSLLFLAVLIQSCNSKSKTSEGEIEPNVKQYGVKSLIDTSDGISETEFNNKSPIEVSGGSGTTFYYNVKLIGPDGKTVEELKGSGTTDSDGKYRPVINWSKPYNSLACGKYTIQISVFSNAERTGDLTDKSITTSVPCRDSYSVTPLITLSDGITETEFKQPPFRITAYPDSTINYTVTLKDSNGNSVVPPKTGSGKANAGTGIFEPSAAEFWPTNDYAVLADKCGNYSIEIKMQNPAAGTPKTETVQTSVPCRDSYSVTPLITLSDGITETEFKQPPFRITANPGSTVNYTVTLKDSKGNPVTDKNGGVVSPKTGTGKADAVTGIIEPSAADFWPAVDYAALADKCGNYSIEIKLENPAGGTPKTETVQTSVPCRDSYSVTPLITLSDGITKTEFKQPPFRITAYPGSTVNYTVTLKDSKGNPVTDKNGGVVSPKTGTGKADAVTGIIEPSAAEFWPAVDYATLADKCGNYSIEIKMQNPAAGTPKTETVQTSVPCVTVKPNFDSTKGISEADFARPYSITATAGERVYYRYKIFQVYTDSSGDKTKTLKEDISGDYISTGTDSPSPAWKNKYAELTCKGYALTARADIKPITDTAMMEPVNTFVPCVSAKPGKTVCGDIATDMTPGKTETFWSKVHQKNITGIIRVGEYKDLLEGENCSDICSGFGGIPAFDYLKKTVAGYEDQNNYGSLVKKSLFGSSCTAGFYGAGIAGGTFMLQSDTDALYPNRLGFNTNTFNQYTPFAGTYAGAMICMCTN